MRATLRKLLRRAQLAWGLWLELCITTQISITAHQSCGPECSKRTETVHVQLGKSVRAAARVAPG